MPGADHGGDGLCGPRGRGTHPRGGRRRLCLEADFADALRRRGQRARRPGGITKPRSAVRALAALFESGPRPCRAQNNPLRADYLILARSEEHTSELPSLMRNSYAVFCLKKKSLIKKQK